MDELFRWVASGLTIGPGILIAARLRPRIVGWSFVALTLGSLVWIFVAFRAADYALLVRNIAISIINTLGIYRWLIWQGREQ